MDRRTYTLTHTQTITSSSSNKEIKSDLYRCSLQMDVTNEPHGRASGLLEHLTLNIKLEY